MTYAPDRRRVSRMMGATEEKWCSHFGEGERVPLSQLHNCLFPGSQEGSLTWDFSISEAHIFARSTEGEVWRTQRAASSDGE